MITLEICVDASAPQTARGALAAAYAGGADRVEVCAAMDVGGVTPPRACIQLARSIFVDRPGVICMIRPRGGDFFYSSSEIEIMLAAIEQAANDGADGVALGALRAADSTLDADAMEQLTTRAHTLDLAVTLHRAFDATPSRTDALESAASLGIQRILTSGTTWGDAAGALDGLDELVNLCTQAQGRLEIVAAGGIAPDHAAHIVGTLHPLGTPISLHAYSGARQDGITDAALVAAIKNIDL